MARRPRPARARRAPHGRGARARRRLLRPRAQPGGAPAGDGGRRHDAALPGDEGARARPSPRRHRARRSRHARAARPVAAGAGLRAARARRRRSHAGAAARGPQDRHGGVRVPGRRARTTTTSTPRRAGATARRRSPARARCSSGTARPWTTIRATALMAVFGVPLLHEDDALRAVRASVELRRMLPRRTRIGVATGEVIAEREPGRAPLATGDADRRGEAAAGGGRARTRSPSTPPRAGSCGSRSALDAGPDGSFRVAALRADGARTRAFSSPLVGRAQQLRALQSTFDARRGRPRLPPRHGSGRRRRGEVAARGRAGGQRWGTTATVLRGRCLPYGEGITYWPLNEVVRDLAGEAGGGSPAGVRDALAAELSGDPKAERRRGRAGGGGRARRDGRARRRRRSSGPREGCSRCWPSAARSWSCWTTSSGRRPPSSTWSSTWRTWPAAPRSCSSASRARSCSTRAAAGRAGS